MNKFIKIIFILSSIILFIAILGIIFLVINNYKHDAKRLTELAVQKNDPSICNEANEEEFMSGQSRSNCYFQVAIQNNNISVCEDYYKTENCFFTVAKQLDNPSLCNKADNLSDRNRCFYGLALYYKDVKICDNIVSDNTTKQNCEQYSK